MVRVNKNTGKGIKKIGSRGIVTRVPLDVRGRYWVQFADGTRMRYKHEELVVLPPESPEQGPPPNEELQRYVVYRCLVGSKAYGLAVEDSDDDVRGVYVPPAALHWSLFGVPAQIEFQHGDRNEIYWEVEKCIRLALKANPNILEILWSPTVLFKTEIADELIAIRRCFLSKYIYRTYRGYVASQMRKMENALRRTGKFKAKHAMHLIRLLHSGTAALRTGEVRVDVAEHRDELLAIRRNEFSFEQIIKRAEQIGRELDKAYETTCLPDAPDYARANRFLVGIRQRMAESSRREESP